MTKSLNKYRHKQKNYKLSSFSGLSTPSRTSKTPRSYTTRYKISLSWSYRRLTFDLHDKHGIPHIGINNPSNCKALIKNKEYQEIMFFDWKIQLEKVQLTRDLKDDTILY